MNVLDRALSAGSAGVVEQLASQFHINPGQAGSAISTLLPAIAGGMKEKLAAGGGSALTGLISGGSLSRFADDPASLATPAAVAQGNSILNQIFGGADLSDLASTAAQKVGIPSSVITAMLPIITALLGGLLSKSSASGEGNLTDILGSLAGGGHSGVMGAIKGLASKVLG
jgi:hypothetical protein